MFKLTAEHLRQLCDLNSFTVDRKSMVFFALRGCLPANPGDHRQGREHSMELAPVDYLRPRCTIAQWLPATNTFAVFPGLRGRVYRALVIGTAGHRIAVRRMLTTIRSWSTMDTRAS